MALTRKAQEVVDYITRQRAKLLVVVEGVSEAQREFKPTAEHWSIKEIAHHLWAVEGATAKLMSNLLRQATENQLPEDADPNASVLNSLDDHAATFTQRFQAPERFVPIDAVALEASIAKLGETRAKLLEPLDALCRYDISSLLYPHPAIGPINAYQWLLVMGAHEARHTAQIKRLMEDPQYPAA